VTKFVALVIASMCVVIIGLLVWGAWKTGDGAAVDDLPTVAEVVAAQAHMHGIELPEVDDLDRERLTAAPSPATTLAPFDQVLIQLAAVRDATGLAEALLLLREVAEESPSVADVCQRLYDALTAGTSEALTLADVCP
jgi:hypothetical protein